MIWESSWLRESGSVFLVCGDNAVIDHVDMAFVLLDETNRELLGVRIERSGLRICLGQIRGGSFRIQMDFNRIIRNLFYTY